MMQEQFPKIFWGHAHIKGLMTPPNARGDSNNAGVFSRHAHAEWQLYSHRASYKYMYMYVCELGNLHRRHCLWERGKKTRSEIDVCRGFRSIFTMHFISADEWLGSKASARRTLRSSFVLRHTMHTSSIKCGAPS